ncbi:hypothetical protein X975_24830, partial [Stegodyphus mimosarum]
MLVENIGNEKTLSTVQYDHFSKRSSTDLPVTGTCSSITVLATTTMLVKIHQ